MDIRNATHARQFVAAWNGHSGRDTMLRIAAEGQDRCASIARQQRLPDEAKRYEAAARVLREAVGAHG